MLPPRDMENYFAALCFRYLYASIEATLVSFETYINYILILSPSKAFEAFYLYIPIACIYILRLHLFHLPRRHLRLHLLYIHMPRHYLENPPRRRGAHGLHVWPRIACSAFNFSVCFALVRFP